VRRIVPMLLLAVAACAHAKTETSPVAEVPAPAPAPAPAPSPALKPIIEAVSSCRKDADCAATQLCLASRCVAIDASTAACEAISTHFEYDQSTIRPDELSSLQRTARCLQARPGASLRIEGNCDERGTAEYNLSLGQRRAASAQRYLVDLGVERDRISAISYGKEKPRCTDQAESCWSENRRDDLLLVK